MWHLVVTVSHGIHRPVYPTQSRADSRLIMAARIQGISSQDLVLPEISGLRISYSGFQKSIWPWQWKGQQSRDAGLQIGGHLLVKAPNIDCYTVVIWQHQDCQWGMRHGLQWGMSPGPWFNIKISSYQHMKFHCRDKTILRPSYLHNGISYTGKTSSLYWIRAQVSIAEAAFLGPCHADAVNP